MFYRKLHIEDKIWLYKIGKWRGENILVKSPEGKRFLLQRKDVVKGVEFSGFGLGFVLYPPQPITPSMVKSHILKHLISPPIKSK